MQVAILICMAICTLCLMLVTLKQFEIISWNQRKLANFLGQIFQAVKNLGEKDATRE